MLQFRDEVEREFWCNVVEMNADEMRVEDAVRYADSAIEHCRARDEELRARRAAETKAHEERMAAFKEGRWW